MLLLLLRANSIIIMIKFALLITRRESHVNLNLQNYRDSCSWRLKHQTWPRDTRNVWAKLKNETKVKFQPEEEN